MSKNLTEMLADIRLDLYDTSTTWSNAELTRCIKRAVGDLSRFLPRELTHEVTIDTDIDDESFTTPAASDTDAIVDAKDISSSVAGDTCTIADYTPDLPRPIIVTVTDANASITAFRIIVKGNDADENYIEESFYLAGGLVQTGKRYFKRVTEVEIDEITGNGASDVLDVGTGSSTGVWMQLANRPIEHDSEAIDGSYTRDTDYEMDYQQGRICLKSGTTMSEGTAYVIDYTKSLIHVDLSSLKDFIRVDRVEYPVGSVPQDFVTPEVYDKILIIRSGQTHSQEKMSDEYHVCIYYRASQLPPNASAPGSYPSFLDYTVELAAAAYALFIKAVMYEHQAITDFASARTETGLANTEADKVAAEVALANTALDGVSFTNSGTYIAAAVTALTAANGEVALANAALDAVAMTDIETALAAANTILDAVLSTSLDRATVGAEGLLDAGDDHINAVGLGNRVPENYREFAQARADIARARVETALAYAQEAAQRLAEMQTYISEASGYSTTAASYINEAAQRTNAAIAELQEQQAMITQAQGYLGTAYAYQQSCQAYLGTANIYSQVAQANLQAAQVFRNEAIERRNEAWTIWRSPPDYAPMYTLGTGRIPGGG